MIKSIESTKVKLLPSIFTERVEVNRKYLLSLNSTALLQNFYLEAGIILPECQTVSDPSQTYLHWGWESPTCQLRGHFLGHWLSAASVLIEEGDEELRGKLNHIIDELARCQEFNGGQWIGSIPQKYFDLLETDNYIWSPQYTMQKTLMGLLHAYIYAKNEKALKILSNVSDWYMDWTSKMLQRCPIAIYKGEEGGMLEVWATLYEITKDNRFMVLAERYSHSIVFDKLLEGKDALTDFHANATIPWAQGAAKMYDITGDEKWLNIVKKFWRCACVERQSFCTGGQNAGEFWIPPHSLGSYMGERNQEFCTVYNMVRLSDYLCRFTGDKIYADYIEKNLYNGFLAQQNKVTGMPTYFLPMREGSRKKWGTPTHDFWCCHGTMIQSQTLYKTLCYYLDDADRTLTVSQYIPSVLEFTANGKPARFEQNIDMKYYDAVSLFDESATSQKSRWFLRFRASIEGQYKIRFRLPKWAGACPFIYINNAEVETTIQDGYIIVDRSWNEGDEIGIYFRTVPYLEYIEDTPEMAAVMEGPVVLAGLIDTDYGIELKGKKVVDTLLPCREHTYTTYPWQQSTYRTRGQKKNFTFVPLYEVTDEQYTLYFTIDEGNDK
ncbi:MAG: glycoside hydrolase family 127 protein [Lachnospiraceae bacterium]|nr:glycoside hydrolase family 127 protein [Lachnospiraceae bacterium]